MADIEIAVINENTVVAEPELAAAVPALQTQVHRDFAKAWGIDADLHFVPKGQIPAQDTWWLTILDDSDRAETVGYHELTPEGRPHGKVFTRSDQSLNIPWTVTASHELLEMLADPNAHLAVFVQPQAYASFLYAYEVCDPCEARAFWYTIDTGVKQVHVSDFVFPAWFEPLPTGSTQFDQGGYIAAPFQLLPGCHMDVYDISRCTWRTFLGEGTASEYGAPSRYGSRRARRRSPRSRWRRSKVLRPSAGVTGAPRSIAQQTSEVLQRLQELQDALSRYWP